MGADSTHTGFSDGVWGVCGGVRQAGSPHLFFPNGWNLRLVVGSTKRPLLESG